MANMTANVQRPVRLPAGGLTTRLLPLAGYTNFGGGSTAFTVFKGAVVACDVSDTDGYFRDGDSGVTWASGDIFGGVALEKQAVTSDNTADGSVLVSVAVDGVWGFPKNSLAQTDVGAPVYATDDGAVVGSSSSNTLWIGDLTEVDATYAWIDISRAAGKPNLSTFG